MLTDAQIAAFLRDVDLVDLSRASTVMRMQVISTGCLLAAFDPAAQEGFEDLTYSVYAPLNEERREILEQIRREGRAMLEGGRAITMHGRYVAAPAEVLPLCLERAGSE